jgi:hypothetical protein
MSVFGIPILFFTENLGRRGDLWATRGGDFTKSN